MVVQIQYFIVWFLFWFLGWGGFYALPRNRRDYIKNFGIISGYFLIVSLIIMFYFHDILAPIYANLTLLPIVLLGIFFLFIFLQYFFSNKYLRKPVELLEKFYSHIAFLSLDYRFLVSKSFDILYQQLLIIVLVFLLSNLGLNIILISIIFAIMFGFGHIAIIKMYKGFFGKLIFFAAIVSSFLFPYLILNFKYGFVYTYIIHWLFYTNSGLLFWVINQIAPKAIESKHKEVTMMKPKK